MKFLNNRVGDPWNRLTVGRVDSDNMGTFKKLQDVNLEEVFPEV